MMPDWIALDQRATPEHLGLVPSFLDEDDPRPAREQFNERYSFGGGWRPFDGFTLDQKNLTLTFPGDPPYEPIACTFLHQKEMIVLYKFSWVAIIQPDKSFEASRMD